MVREAKRRQEFGSRDGLRMPVSGNFIHAGGQRGTASEHWRGVPFARRSRCLSEHIRGRDPLVLIVRKQTERVSGRIDLSRSGDGVCRNGSDAGSDCSV